MKTFFAILFGVSLIFLASCKNDDTPDPTNVSTLNLDGDNFASPALPDGKFEFAARFVPNSLGESSGGKLYEVEVYIFEIPQSLKVKVYRKSLNDKPVDLVFEQNATLGITAQAWNTITLTDSVDVVADEDLWISVEFTQEFNQRIIGCDQGPAVTDGDWFYDADLTAREWVPYSEETSGGVDVNWNIRGKVAN